MEAVLHRSAGMVLAADRQDLREIYKQLLDPRTVLRLQGLYTVNKTASINFIAPIRWSINL